MGNWEHSSIVRVIWSSLIFEWVNNMLLMQIKVNSWSLANLFLNPTHRIFSHLHLLYSTVSIKLLGIFSELRLHLSPYIHKPALNNFKLLLSLLVQLLSLTGLLLLEWFKLFIMFCYEQLRSINELLFVGSVMTLAITKLKLLYCLAEIFCFLVKTLLA